MAKRGRPPANAIYTKSTYDFVEFNGPFGSRWRDIFNERLTDPWFHNPEEDGGELIKLEKGNMGIVGLAKVSPTAVSLWGVKMAPGNIGRTEPTRWDRKGATRTIFVKVQDFLEHLFYGPVGKHTAERRAFHEAYDHLPPFNLSGEAKTRVLWELATNWRSDLSLLSLSPGAAAAIVTNDAFTRDVLTMVQRGDFREHPAIVAALSRLAAAYETRGGRAVANAITAPVAKSLLKNNDLNVAPDIIADLLHVCEVIEESALEYAQSGTVSTGRKWQEHTCAACVFLKHREIDAAAGLLEVVEGNLDSCSSDVRGMLRLHRGRIALLRAVERGRPRRTSTRRRLLEESQHELLAAEAALRAVSPAHQFIPHVQAYRYLSEMLDAPRDEVAAKLSATCTAIESTVLGESCLDPCRLAAELTS